MLSWQNSLPQELIRDDGYIHPTISIINPCFRSEKDFFCTIQCPAMQAKDKSHFHLQPCHESLRLHIAPLDDLDIELSGPHAHERPAS